MYKMLHRKPVLSTMEAPPTLSPILLQKTSTLLSSPLCHSKSSCPGHPILLLLNALSLIISKNEMERTLD